MTEQKIFEKLEEIHQEVRLQNLLNKSILSFKEACQYLGLSESHLYKLTSKKEIPHSCPNGKKIFFQRNQLDEYLLRNPQKTNEDLDKAADEYISKNKL